MNIQWAEQLNVAVTVSDTDGNIVYMNQKSGDTFSEYGGKELVGKSLYDCHNPKSVNILKDLLANKDTNVYTIEKNGLKKLIYQTPWYENDKLMGLVELSLEIPFDLPHFVRG